MNDASLTARVESAVETESLPYYYERSALAYSAPRDLGAGMRMIDEMERKEGVHHVKILAKE